jgi:hypothetical protein
MVDAGAGWYSIGLRELAASMRSSSLAVSRRSAASETDASTAQNCAPILDDRGQPAALDGYEPRNR